MNRIRPLTASDFDAILRYLDDDLGPVEAVQFDARLASEPALAAGLEQIMAIEAMGRGPSPPCHLDGYVNAESGSGSAAP